MPQILGKNLCVRHQSRACQCRITLDDLSQDWTFRCVIPRHSGISHGEQGQHRATAGLPQQPYWGELWVMLLQMHPILDQQLNNQVSKAINHLLSWRNCFSLSLYQHIWKTPNTPVTATMA